MWCVRLRGQTTNSEHLPGLAHIISSPNLPRDSLKWNIKGSIEFPTSTNSPCPGMALGNRKTNNNNKLCFSTQPKLFVKDDLKKKKKKTFLCCLVWPKVYFKEQTLTYQSSLLCSNPCPSLSFLILAFRRSRPVLLCFLFFSILVNEEDRCGVIDTWANQKLRDWGSSLGSTVIS